MAKKVVKFSLSPESITQALNDLKVYKEQYEAKRHMLMEVIVARGVQIVKEELQELVYSQPGEEYRTMALLESIQGEYDSKTGTGRIWTDNYYAPFVEFGTGITGGQAPHPESGIHGWAYGTEGWFYYNDRVDSVLFTVGFRSRPFMYNAAKRLRSEVPRIVKEVFA